MNRKVLILFLCTLISVLSLTGCMPPGYSSSQVQSVTEEHSDEAKTWFADNMPDADVESARAYKDGIHLYALIGGTYRRNGAVHDYFYDYESGQMYTDEPYQKALNYARRELADTLGVDEAQIELYPADWHIATQSLDDRDPDEYVNSAAGSIFTNGLEVLPWDADPKEWGKRMVYEGLDDGQADHPQTSFAMIYVETIPAYDASVFETLKGISSLDYIQPITEVYDGICREDHAADSRKMRYVHLEEWESGVNIGYSYEVKESFDENGNTTEISDPLEGKDKDMHAADLGGGRIGFTLPNGAEALLLAPEAKKGKEYTDEYTLTNGEVKHPVWEESLYFDCEYMPGSNLVYFSRYSILLPRGDARLYYRYEWGQNEYYDFSVNIR
ncbi:MAG: hypothetical protein IK115_12755 [Lachnospiraceae bacterium]|nr:hypothetical protein [Lachnospiraceae bacterium]